VERAAVNNAAAFEEAGRVKPRESGEFDVQIEMSQVSTSGARAYSLMMKYRTPYVDAEDTTVEKWACRLGSHTDIMCLQ